MVKALYFDGLCYEDGKIWGIEQKYGNIAFLDKDSFQIKQCFELPMKKFRDYYKVWKKGDFLLVFPGYADEIVKYHMITGESEVLFKNVCTEEFYEFHTLIENMQKLYALPIIGNKIRKIDFENKKMTEIDLPYKTKVTLWGKYINREKEIIVTCKENPDLLVFNVDSEIFERKRVGTERIGFVDILVKGEYIYLLSFERKIIRVNSDYSNARCVCVLQEEYKYILEFGDAELLLIPKYSKKIVAFNIQTEELRDIDCPKQLHVDEEREGVPFFAEIVEDEENYYVLPRIANMIICVNKSGSVRFANWSYKVKNNDIGAILRNRISMEGDYSLDDFIQSILG